MNRRIDKRLLGLILFLVVFVDQISKVVCRRFAGRGCAATDDLLSFLYTENTGAAWSILQGNSMWLGVLGIIAILLLMHAIKHTQIFVSCFGYTMILGGVIGNTIDRFMRGYVIDFISVNLKFYRWPTFNIADSAIFIGVGILLFTFSQKGQEAC